jgi:hypothetical protein
MAAFQVPLNIECPKNFTVQEKVHFPSLKLIFIFSFQLNKISCVKETHTSGTWNIYTQKAVCPSSYQPIIDRRLKKKYRSQVLKNIQTTSTDRSNYHLPLNVSPTNISCVRVKNKSVSILFH